MKSRAKLVSLTLMGTEKKGTHKIGEKIRLLLTANQTKNFSSDKTWKISQSIQQSTLQLGFFKVKLFWQEISTKKNRIYPSKISGPYSLLAVKLLVAEILFAIWFYKSQGSIERTIVVSIKELVFICLMIFVLRMNTINYRQQQKIELFTSS